MRGLGFVAAMAATFVATVVIWLSASGGAFAQDFSGGAWVLGCEKRTSGPYVVTCDGYGGALFDARRPADCEFGSFFGCKRTNLCQLANVMTIRDWSGAAMSKAALGCNAGGGGGSESSPPKDPLARCEDEKHDGLCRRCITEKRPELAICKRYFQ